MRKVFLQVRAWLISLIASTGATAQKRASIQLVPAANWELVNSQGLAPDSVRQWGGDPAVDREYGVKSLERRTYQLGNKLAEVFIEEASDASAAYGLFTF